jgi:uncharacterized protein (TIGR01627 family)
LVQAADLVKRLRHGAGRRLRTLFAGGDDSPFEASRMPELCGQPVRFGPVLMLSVEPPVFLSGISFDGFLGFAPSFAHHHGNTPAAFIIFPTWSIETPQIAERLSAAVRRHILRYDQHRFRYICNTPSEAELLNDAGQPALFLNHKVIVSDRIFRPVDTVPVEFDAIYNARFVAWKRHELAAAIERVAYVAYAEPQESWSAEFRTLWPETMSRSPRHVLLNRIEDGLPVAFSHQDVNLALNRAAIGLVLSAVEGASYAAMEYMLAGLPVVSTPSRGGRDVFFDPDYCAVVDPDPRSIREAVAALRIRNIPRHHIREQTLKRIEQTRQDFLALIDDALEDLGTSRRFQVAGWQFGESSGVPWGDFDQHIAAFAKVPAAALARELGLDDGALADVQMTVGELRPIIRAIRENPGGALLVFGCGHDSPMWERLNAGGVTAFIEDDPEWVAIAKARLRNAAVHLVQYGTTRSDWRKMLKRPAALSMPLPDDIRSRRWNVIFVDGPAGYDDARPGRMKSIYEASRLIAPRGKVFLHDSERAVEAAYAARYLGDRRLFVEVKGRAVLRGYGF